MKFLPLFLLFAIISGCDRNVEGRDKTRGERREIQIGDSRNATAIIREVCIDGTIYIASFTKENNWVIGSVKANPETDALQRLSCK